MSRKNPKHEIRNPKQILNPNSSKNNECLEFDNSDLFRVSILEFDI